MTPPVIVPSETDVNKDLKAQVTFVLPHHDITATVNFETSSGVAAFPISGSVLGIVSGATGTLINYMVTKDSTVMSGIQASGDCDATYFLSINGQTVARFSSNIIVPNIDYQFPMSVSLNSGDTVVLKVQNNGSASADFTGSLFGLF